MRLLFKGRTNEHKDVPRRTQHTEPHLPSGRRRQTNNRARGRQKGGCAWALQVPKGAPTVAAWSESWRPVSRLRFSEAERSEADGLTLLLNLIRVYRDLVSNLVL